MVKSLLKKGSAEPQRFCRTLGAKVKSPKIRGGMKIFEVFGVREFDPIL